MGNDTVKEYGTWTKYKAAFAASAIFTGALATMSAIDGNLYHSLASGGASAFNVAAYVGADANQKAILAVTQDESLEDELIDEEE